MPKVTLEFNLPEESSELDMALKAASYSIAFDEVWEQLFRPRFKHGYPDERIEELLKDNNCQELMDILADMYHNLRKDIIED